MTLEYKTKGTCSRKINITTEGEYIGDVKFEGGCNGNLQAVSLLVKGMKIDDVVTLLEGTNCNGKGTSCPDQLAKALKEMQSMTTV